MLWTKNTLPKRPFPRTFTKNKSDKETLSLIKLEIDNCLKNDFRLVNFTSEVNYDGDGVLQIAITVNYQGIVKKFNYVLERKVLWKKK